MCSSSPRIELPLIERVKFLAIFVTNLDEFFMIRVAGVHDQIDARIDARGPDGLTPTEVLRAIHDRCQQDAATRAQFSRGAARSSPRTGSGSSAARSPAPRRRRSSSHFREQIFPVLTPLAVGAGRPFPYISNLSLSLIVRLHDPETDHEVFARVKVPKEVLPRFVEIEKDTFIPLEDVIARHLDALFPGMEIVSHDLFRVTRDADFDVSDEADDLLQAVEDELRRRRFGEVVRLEVGAGMDRELRTRLIEWLDVDEVQVYDVEGLLDLGDLWQIAGSRAARSCAGRSGRRSRIRAWPRRGTATLSPTCSRRCAPATSSSTIPYQSFSSSVERFVSQASTTRTCSRSR